MKLLKYVFFISLVIKISYGQVYLGLVDKEGIFLEENLNSSGQYSYDYLEGQLNRITYNSTQSIIYDNYQKEFNIFTKINKGDKYFITCSENITQESVSGYIIYDWNGITKEFYPLISNKTNLCKVTEDEKSIVIISKNQIKNTINFNKFTDEEITQIIKKRILEDVKNFEVPGAYNEIKRDYDKEFIQAVYDENLTIFKGSFCNKSTEEYFVSYVRGSDNENYVNVNYVMDSKANVIEFFTTPRDISEYRSIIATCDYDNDDLDEVIISNRYYEGGGFELWKYDKGKFIKVTEGFYFGV